MAAGAEVTGVARTRGKATELRDLGATPRAGEPVRPGQASRCGHGPFGVVCNLATAIPTGEQAARRTAWSDNQAIRRDGARNLVNATLRAGADRYVQESISFLYADGADEVPRRVGTGRPDVDHRGRHWPPRAKQPGSQRSGGAGIALRFGAFYGPDSAHTINAIEAAGARPPRYRDQQAPTRRR